MQDNYSLNIPAPNVQSDLLEHISFRNDHPGIGDVNLNDSVSAYDWLRVYSETVPAALALIRASDGQFCYVNQKCYNFLQLRSADLHSKKLADFVDLDDGFDQFKDKCLLDGSFINREVRLFREKGESLPAYLSLSSITLGDIDCFLIAFSNSCGFYEMEEGKERLLEELEISRDQVEEEAGKLVQLNAQLEQSEEKLRQINAAKDKLFSIIGHDLKNPFYVITSYADILYDDYETLSNEERLEFVKIIQETSGNAHKLLENLLHWSRSQTGRIEFVPEPLILRRLISNSVQLLSSQAAKKNIELTYSAAPSIIVMADKNMLDTVIRNLLSNAIKFTCINGSVTVRAEESGQNCIVSVQDTGIGLTESDKQKLFRIDVNNTEIGHSKEKGTGLGLILCKEFVERHNGTIWVESEPGKGSNFRFMLPKGD
jgi:signal transduction histidine kinase